MVYEAGRKYWAMRGAQGFAKAMYRVFHYEGNGQDISFQFTEVMSFEAQTGEAMRRVRAQDIVGKII